MTSRKTYFAPHIEETNASFCAADGCVSRGLYKAPKSSAHACEYQMLCLEHVQEFNRKWDYFKGMQQDEIEAFMTDAITGHRPTWRREDDIADCLRRSATFGLEEALQRLLHSSGSYARNASLNHKERDALAMMELEAPCSLVELKKTYRALVKRYHPDLHQGKKLYEDKFKKITEAYRYLKELYSTGRAQARRYQ